MSAVCVHFYAILWRAYFFCISAEEKCAIKWSLNKQLINKLREKRNLQLAMEVYMRAMRPVISVMCFRWCCRLDFETCRQSVQVADGHARKPMRLYVDGQHWRRFLALPAVATLRQRVIDSLPLRPRNVFGGEKHDSWVQDKWMCIDKKRRHMHNTRWRSKPMQVSLLNKTYKIII